MIELKVEKVGFQEAIFGLKNFGNDISLLSEPLVDSARYMQQQAIMNFGASGALMQKGGWKELADSTKDVKEGRISFRTFKGRKVPMKPIKGDAYPGAPIMVRTGTLKNSFEIEGPRIGKDYGEIEVFNPIEYAVYHQKGGAILSQRILLRFQKQQIQDITNIFTRWIDKITNKNFK